MARKSAIRKSNNKTRKNIVGKAKKLQSKRNIRKFGDTAQRFQKLRKGAKGY